MFFPEIVFSKILCGYRMNPEDTDGFCPTARPVTSATITITTSTPVVHAADLLKPQYFREGDTRGSETGSETLNGVLLLELYLTNGVSSSS